MPKGFISIGSNIDKEKKIPDSVKALRELFGKLVISDVYESEAVGFVGDTFYNLVVGFDSDQDVKEICKQLRQIELDNGRDRNCKKFSARTLDLDLLMYGDLVIDDGRLQIPREDIKTYAFVLAPLAEIAGNLAHPVSGERLSQMWEKFDKTQVKQHKVKLLL